MVNTENEIQKTFISLSEKYEFNEIDVNMICKALDIKRQTFYYHFKNIYDVIFSIYCYQKIQEPYENDMNSLIRNIFTFLYSDQAFNKIIAKSNASDVLTEFEKEKFKNVLSDMSDSEAAASLQQLSGYLYRYYGKKVIILLDEYDTPMQEAFMDGYWDELSAFIRNLFNATFKGNPYLEKAIMTGITRVSKESIFSDLNNLNVITTTSGEYADFFGFTEKEVFKALDEYGLTDKKNQVKDWYDGFTFGDCRDIYNPWSIINYLKQRKFAPYWANTSSNSLAGKLVREGSNNVKRKFEDLLNNKSLKVSMDEQIVFDQLSVKESSIWSLLLTSGYLKVMKTELDEQTGQMYYQVALTNKEVRIMFDNIIRGWFADYDSGYNDFIKALIRDDLDAMNAYMNRVALTTLSFFDSGTKPSGESEPERFYHGFVLGLLVDLRGRYTVTSNRESGFGRYDVMLEPSNQNDDAFILEFKVQDPSREKTLEETVEEAIGQIKEKGYVSSLIEKGIPTDHIKKYGFAFCGKKVLIGQ